jgi:hypothetical protein
MGERFLRSHSWSQIYEFLERFLFRAFGGFPAAQRIAGQVLRALSEEGAFAYSTILIAGTILVPLGFALRILARSSVRAGNPDPLDRVRRRVARRPKTARAVVAVPGALWALATLAILRQMREYGGLELAPEIVYQLPVVLGFWAVDAAARSGLRALLGPTIDDHEESSVEISADEIVFDAVAVTRETKAAVGALAAISFLFVAWLACLPILRLFKDPHLFGAVGAYVTLALSSALVFRRASRVAVGVDGVRVAGTSRTRFYSYKDLDGVQVNGGDVELIRSDKVVLRLQLHGADAIRRDAVCARIRTHIHHVKSGKDAMAAQLVASATAEQLTRVAAGGADYRAASLSREALWALIEGPAVDAPARQAAAKALARTNDDSERVRLRVAAEHCADPSVRLALERLAEAHLESAGDGAPAKVRATSTIA